MNAQAIGSLFVSLGLDTALFTAGMKNATGGLGKFAGKLQSIGAGMSAAITAPLMGLAASAQVAANNLADLENQSRIAGMSAQDFKVLALASETFGIQQEKVADILKDVNDKMGDFMQTGAGPLKDFFEKIAPKVGVTADQFRDLNGADALALYVSSLERANLSQAEMTFYMEAIASDASALLPVFSDNAKALKAMEAEATRLGLKLDGDLIASAKATADQFRITKDVLGIQFQQALVQLAPAVSELMGAIIPLITKLASGVTWLAEGFAGLSPEVQGFIAAAVGIAAVAGPAILGLGLAIPAVTGLATVFGALAMALIANPVVAIIGAIAGGAYLIYRNWEGISAWFSNLWGTVKAAFSGDWEAIKALLLQYTPLNIIYRNWEGISAWFRSIWGGVQRVFSESWAAIGRMAIGAYEAHKAAWTGAADYFEGLIGVDVRQAFDDGWQAVKAMAAQWVADFLAIGGNIVDGLKEGIQAKWDEVTSVLSGLTGGLIGETKTVLKTHSPSRVFHEIGGWIAEGLGLGLKDGVPGVKSAMQTVLEAVGADGITEGLYSFRDAARGIFSQVALQGKNLGEVLRNSLGNWFGNIASNLFNSGFNALWGAIGLPTFANGTNDFAGGLAIVGERGPEIVNLPSGSRVNSYAASSRMVDRMGGGATEIYVYADPSVIVSTARGEAVRVVQQARPGIVKDSVQATYSAAKEVPIG